MLKSTLIILLSCLICFNSFSWGLTGHRIVGFIAEQHLTSKAKKNISKILNEESIAQVSNFMDFIKSDINYRHMNPWHYCTIPDEKTYSQSGIPNEGDIIQTIQRLIKELKAKKFTDNDEAFALKCLIHLMGDIHQPLHVGNGIDKGGNDVKLKFFSEDSNLHKVWDSDIIDFQSYSYTEYSDWINKSDQSEKILKNGSVRDWANESKAYRKQVYNLPEDMNLSYRYNYDNIELLNKRLLQAGLRLAEVLNEIYG